MGLVSAVVVFWYGRLSVVAHVQLSMSGGWEHWSGVTVIILAVKDYILVYQLNCQGIILLHLLQITPASSPHLLFCVLEQSISFISLPAHCTFQIPLDCVFLPKQELVQCPAPTMWDQSTFISPTTCPHLLQGTPIAYTPPWHQQHPTFHDTLLSTPFQCITQCDQL